VSSEQLITDVLKYKSCDVVILLTPYSTESSRPPRVVRAMSAASRAVNWHLPEHTLLCIAQGR
jgi:hypothetical protein